MYKKLLSALMMSLIMSCVVNADTLEPDHLVEFGQGTGVRIWSRSAAQVEKYNITQRVVDLYNQEIKDMQEGITLVSDGCLYLYINTENGIKNFITQIVTKDKKCFKQ
jgi:hypothetical protein